MKEYTEKELKQIHDDYTENVNWYAPKEVTGAYNTLRTALDDYIAAVSEFEFKNGFKYAQMQEGREVQ